MLAGCTGSGGSCVDGSGLSNGSDVSGGRGDGVVDSRGSG